MTTSASRGMATVTSLRLCSRAPETTIWACRDTRSSVRNARTDPSNTCSHPAALCGRGWDRVGAEPGRGTFDDQLGAIRGRADPQPLRGAEPLTHLLDRLVGRG